MRLSIAFYHPKNPQNLWDVAAVAEALKANLYVVPRPTADYKLDQLPRSLRSRIKLIDSLGRLSELERGSEFIVLETYGDKLITELRPHCGDVVLIVGAEDYGVPMEALSGLESYSTYLIPVAVEGMSYNVVTSIVMAAYEVLRGRIEVCSEGSEGESLT
jgi:tRNA (cytidine/uridine-2'-O-)-methyltransferase